MPPKTLSILTCILLIITSCQKEISTQNEQPGPDNTNNNNPGTEFVRIQQGVDPDITNDTVWLISYTPSKKVKMIVDSLYGDTSVAEYDASDRLAKVKTSYDNDASYVYDASGLLTRINFMNAGSKERFDFEYTGGIISKSTYSSDLGSGGSYKPWRYETFTVKDGNITEVKQYTMAGVLEGQAVLNYGSQLNPFKNLSLFNYANRLGMEQIVNFYSFFNKNISSGITIGANSFKTTNTYNNQKITKITSQDFNGNGGSFTWLFSYK